MLTRPGSDPGPHWMRRVSEGFSDPATWRRWSKWFWVCFAVIMVFSFALSHLLARATSGLFESTMRLGELPLVAYGPQACGIIAIGGQATGVLALGGVAIGVIAVGGVALGGIAFSGLSAGILAMGGGALGWWAFGGGAVGYYAFGGLAVGGYAYAGGGVALRYHEASGGQKEQLLG